MAHSLTVWAIQDPAVHVPLVLAVDCQQVLAEVFQRVLEVVCPLGRVAASQLDRAGACLLALVEAYLPVRVAGFQLDRGVACLQVPAAVSLQVPAAAVVLVPEPEQANGTDQIPTANRL